MGIYPQQGAASYYDRVLRARVPAAALLKEQFRGDLEVDPTHTRQM